MNNQGQLENEDFGDALEDIPASLEPYKVLQGADLEQLQTCVNAHIVNGYEVTGGVAIEKIEMQVQYFQAVRLIEERNPDAEREDKAITAALAHLPGTEGGERATPADVQERSGREGSRKRRR